MKKEDLYVHVEFDNGWIQGYLDRRGDRLASFKKNLTELILNKVRELTPCRVCVVHSYDAVIRPSRRYLVTVCRAFGAAALKEDNDLAVEKATEVCIKSILSNMKTDVQ